MVLFLIEEINIYACCYDLNLYHALHTLYSSAFILNFDNRYPQFRIYIMSVFHLQKSKLLADYILIKVLLIKSLKCCLVKHNHSQKAQCPPNLLGDTPQKKKRIFSFEEFKL